MIISLLPTFVPNYAVVTMNLCSMKKTQWKLFHHNSSVKYLTRPLIFSNYRYDVVYYLTVVEPLAINYYRLLVVTSY